MIELKANDVKDLPFTLLQNFGTEDEAPWNLDGCTVQAIVSVNGVPDPFIITPVFVDRAAGQIMVRIDTEVTGFTFGANQKWVDAHLELEVVTSDGHVESLPKGSYFHIRIYRDLDGM